MMNLIHVCNGYGAGQAQDRCYLRDLYQLFVTYQRN